MERRGEIWPQRDHPWWTEPCHGAGCRECEESGGGLSTVKKKSQERCAGQQSRLCESIVRKRQMQPKRKGDYDGTQPWQTARRAQDTGEPADLEENNVKQCAVHG